MKRLIAIVTPVLLAFSNAGAQENPAAYPSGPIRIVCGFPAGGGVDVMARIVANHLQKAWGKSVVVENRVGAGGNVGAEHVFNAKPDGYVLLASAPAPFTVNRTLYRALRYDPEKLTPVSIGAITPIVLAVSYNANVKNAAEFITHVKANPGRLNYSSQGLGTSGHLISAMLEQKLGSKLVHVPYSGAAPAINDLAAGQVDFLFSDLGGVKALADAGKVLIIATTTERRVPLIPDTPTFGELGISDFIGDSWWGFAAPPSTPLAIREKVAREIGEAVKASDVISRFNAMGVQPLGNSPSQMQATIETDRKRWGEVIRSAKIVLD